MRKMLLTLVAVGFGCLIGFLFGSKVTSVQGKSVPGSGFAAVPGQVGGQDVFGGYEVDKDWPKNISTTAVSARTIGKLSEDFRIAPPGRLVLTLCFLSSGRIF